MLDFIYTNMPGMFDHYYKTCAKKNVFHSTRLLCVSRHLSCLIYIGWNTNTKSVRFRCEGSHFNPHIIFLYR